MFRVGRCRGEGGSTTHQERDPSDVVPGEGLRVLSTYLIPHTPQIIPHTI